MPDENNPKKSYTAGLAFNEFLIDYGFELNEPFPVWVLSSSGLLITGGTIPGNQFAEINIYNMFPDKDELSTRQFIKTINENIGESEKEGLIDWLYIKDARVETLGKGSLVNFSNAIAVNLNLALAWGVGIIPRPLLSAAD